MKNWTNIIFFMFFVITCLIGAGCEEDTSTGPQDTTSNETDPEKHFVGTEGGYCTSAGTCEINLVCSVNNICVKDETTDTGATDSDSDTETETATDTQDTETTEDLLNTCAVIEAQIVGNWRVISFDDHGIVTTVEFDKEQTLQKGICTWVTDNTMNSDNIYYSNSLPMETYETLYSKVWVDEQNLLNITAEGDGDGFYTFQYERI